MGQDKGGNAFNDIRFALLNVGIRVNMKKTTVLCKPRGRLPPGWFGVRSSEDGLVVLRSPIGSVAFVRRTALVIIDRYKSIIPHVGRFPPKIAFPLIRDASTCDLTCAEPQYRGRTQMPWEGLIVVLLSVISKYHTGNALPNPPLETLVDLDNRLPLDDRADLVRQLAVDEDGGMHVRAGNHLRESAYAASIKFLSEKMGNLVARLKNHLMSEGSTGQLQSQDIKETLNAANFQNADDLLNLLVANSPVQRDFYNCQEPC
jgi:hypothetical protein